ncbi:hypothetical protein GH5_06802 [Leishmania sp. Ghana 2012 LV757]|uniref:DUF306 domain-containing protein n=1 Tax=Leishmania orientalis TaxID=2249476 RepID=A0A836GGY6_9TRYP|nr:hypothetical protein LSCM4_06934 [Leishmania orientalis]KAG5508552.1 hypothetical protein GH5_06802 [Leishmania sp. Ghana 2012 LV757]
MEVRNLFGKYIAKFIDDKPVPAGVMIEFKAGGSNDAVDIQGRVVNNMNGHLKVEGSKLSGLIRSTSMAGSDELMMMEDALIQGFADGMKCLLKDGGKLTLQSDSHTFKFVSA